MHIQRWTCYIISMPSGRLVPKWSSNHNITSVLGRRKLTANKNPSRNLREFKPKFFLIYEKGNSIQLPFEYHPPRALALSYTKQRFFSSSPSGSSLSSHKGFKSFRGGLHDLASVVHRHKEANEIALQRIVRITYSKKSSKLLVGEFVLLSFPRGTADAGVASIEGFWHHVVYYIPSRHRRKQFTQKLYITSRS
jgi:hypothetical protein